MTWFRVDVGLGEHQLVGAIVEGLGVSIPEAAGLYTLTLAGFAEYQPDGMVRAVTNTTLEEWAKWNGEGGKFARFFRRHCIQRRPGQQDPPGVVKGWWRNKKLLEEQERSRRKPGQGTRKALRGLFGANSGPSRGNVDVDVVEISKDLVTSRTTNIPTSQQTERRAREGPRAVLGESTVYLQRCTAAANRGLRENTTLNGFNELVASAQDEPRLWLDAGIPIEIAEAAIFNRAKAYRPSGTRRQPTTLRYFTQAVEEAWSRSQSGAREAGVNVTEPATAEPEDEFVKAGREYDAKLARERAARA